MNHYVQQVIGVVRLQGQVPPARVELRGGQDKSELVNHCSGDRTPGLGLEAVEPAVGAHRFCAVEDTMLGVSGTDR